MRIAYVTFGCRLNRAQAARDMAALAAAGHEIVDAASAPDRIIVRGCSVTAKAAREGRRAVSALRKANPQAAVFAAGCLDAAGVPRAGTLEAPRGTGFAPQTARGYLEIQDGCSGKCAYCIVSRFRGAPRSAPWRALEAEARAFLAAGCTEIVVTGCNAALYRDPESGLDLAGLLERLARMESPGHRIRLGSLEPGVCDAAVVDAMARNPNICRFLHLSVQSASARVLGLMRRAYGPDALERAAAAARKAMPGIALGADVIAGFPGETDADFRETADFVARFRISNLHVFPYSERPGTEAASMSGAVPPEVRRRRARELAAAGERIRREFAASFVSAPVEVCIERPAEEGRPAGGWTAEYLRCTVDCPAPRRALVRAVAVSASDGALHAVVRQNRPGATP